MFSFVSPAQSASKGRTLLVLLVALVVAAFLAMGMSSPAFAAKKKVVPLSLTILTSTTEAAFGDRGVPVVGAKVELYKTDFGDSDDEGDDGFGGLAKTATFITNAAGVAKVTGIDPKDDFDEYAIYIDPTSATPGLDSAGWYIPSYRHTDPDYPGVPTCDASTSPDFNDEDGPCVENDFYSGELSSSDTVHLMTSATVEGAITDPEGAATSVASKVVLLRKTTDTDDTRNWDEAAEETLTGQTTYEFTGVAPGNYVVEADVDPATEPTWAEKTFNEGAANVTTATQLVVASGDISTQNVSFGYSGSISGTVAYAASGVGEIDIDAYPISAHHNTIKTGGKSVAHAEVAAGSSYQLNVAPGKYKLQFTPVGDAADTYYQEWYSNSADSVYATGVDVTSVGDSEVGIDATLGTGLNISGSVSAAGGNQDGLLVDAVPVGDEWGDNEQETTVTGGTYHFTGLVPGEYVLEFSDPDENYPDVYYNGVTNGTQDDSAATVFSQAHGDIVANFDYSETATIVVHVATKAGKPVASAIVVAASTTDGDLDSDSQGYPGFPVPGHPGLYVIQGVPAGQPYVIALLDKNFAVQYWGGATNGEPNALFTPVAGQNSLDFTDSAGYALSGTVTSPSKKPVGGVAVGLYRFDGSDWTVAGETETSSKGKYSFASLPTGSYTVDFDGASTGRNYADTFAGGGTDPSTATAVYVSPGSPAVLNGTLSPGGSISGTAVFEGGAPDTQDEYVVPVVLTGTPGNFTEATVDGDYETEVASNGKFTVTGLATGYYSLSFYDADDYSYGDPYQDPTTNPSAFSIHVVEGQVSTVPGTITIPKLPTDATAHIDGSLDLSMAPNSGDIDGDVYLTDVNGNYFDATIDEDGNFSADVVPGTYVVDPELQDEDFPGISYVAAEQTITVVAGDQSLSIPVVQANPLAFTSDPQLLASNPDPSAALTDVGSTYTIDPSAPGTVNDADAMLTYQWLRNGKAIRGATGTSYTLVAADAGASVQLKVTAVNVYEESVRDYAPAISVTPSHELSNTTAPSTSADSAGLIYPGQAVTADPGDWNGITGVRFSYNWVLSGSPTTSLGTGQTFTPTPSEVGDLVVVQVTASKSGYDIATPTVASDVPLTVTSLAAPTVKTQPKVTKVAAGTGKTKFTVTPGTWSVVGTTPTYQWSVGGTPVTGATSNSFVFDSGDTSDYPNGAASGVTVAVGAAKAGYVSGTTMAVAQLDTTSAVTTTYFAVEGDGGPTGLDDPVYPGELLTADVDPDGGITFGSDGSTATNFTFQWLRGTTVIPGQNGQSYTVTGADVGQTLTAVVIASSSTHGPASFPEDAGVGTVSSALVTSPAVVTADDSNTNAPQTKITELVSGWGTVTGVTNSYQWYDCVATADCGEPATLTNYTLIPGATSASYTPSVSQESDSLVLVVTGSKVGYTDGVVQSQREVIQSGLQIGVTAGAAITGGLTAGHATYGVKLTVKSAKFNVAGVTPEYTWQVFTADGNWVNGQGVQDKTTYTPVLADFAVAGSSARLIRMYETATKSGYNAGHSLAAPVSLLGATPKPTVKPSISTVTNGWTVNNGTWPTAGGVGNLTYQWYYDGTPASTSQTWTPGDIGPTDAVWVVVSYTAPAYTEVDTTILAKAGTAPASNAPEITGNPQLGNVLTVEPTDAGYMFEYPGGLTSHAVAALQWYVGTSTFAKAKAISGARSVDFTPTAADVGKKLWVSIKSTSPYFAATSTVTPEFDVVAGAEIHGSVTLSPGTQPSPGAVLTAQLSGYPSGVLHQISWQLLPAGGSDWVTIPGATKATYTVLAGQLGESIRVAVQTAPAGYDPAIDYGGSPTIVEATALIPTTKPSVTTTSPSPAGSVVSVSPGVWNVVGTTFTYQWYQDGAILPGATSATFTSDGSQVGSELEATVTAHLPGYDPVQLWAHGSVDVSTGAAPTALTLPKISGTAKVGSTLTATTGLWSIDTLRFSYQWFTASDNAPIDGATLDTYTLTDTDAGSQVYVVVTAVRTGYANGSAQSAPSATIH